LEEFVLITHIRQTAFTLQILFGDRIALHNLRKLVSAARTARQEYGPSNLPTVSHLLYSQAVTTDYQDHMLERSIGAARRHSPFYRAHLAHVPQRITRETVRQVPLTHRRDLHQHGPLFLTDNAHPVLTVGSSGTTGVSIQISYSQNELEVWAALGALSALLTDDVDAGCLLAINLQSLAAYRYFQQWMCLQAELLPIGLMPPEECLDLLMHTRCTVPPLLATYPTGLGTKC
jgi:phenylacetate-CoA ligase